MKIYSIKIIITIASLFIINQLEAQFFPGAKLKDTLQHNIVTPEYKELQDKLCKGWNTWYNNNALTHVLLPESFAINLCLSTNNNRFYLGDAIKTSEILGLPEKVTLGLRADDGSYTSLNVQYQGIDISVESAVDGEDQLIIVTPRQSSDDYLVVEAGLLWDRQGTIGMENGKLIGKFNKRTIEVGSTIMPISNPYSQSKSPRITFRLKGSIGLFTGKNRTLAELKELISKAREREQKRADSYGDLSESFIAMQTILAWNTIYDAPNHRAITPVSRVWNKDQGGWVLYEWDTNLASLMLSLFNKDLAYSNAVQIVKGITPNGFIPSRISISRGVTNYLSQPPLGSMVVWNIYNKYQEKWFLTEVYNELLSWNRWWEKHRSYKNYLSWGNNDPDMALAANYERIRKYAINESGLDNSHMYDGVAFNLKIQLLDIADVGLMSMYIMDCNYLAQIAGELGKKDDAKELKDRAAFFSKQLATLWDEETGIFLNKHTDTEKLSDRISPTNFYPMLAGACTQKQARRMIDEHYFNPEEFYGTYVIPSTPRNDPAFKDNDYWRGRIWGPMNFLVYLGMRNYDLKDARTDLINKSKDLLMKNWKESGGIFENYNSVTGAGNDVKNADGFYHWGALLTFIEFMEKGYMDAKQH